MRDLGSKRNNYELTIILHNIHNLVYIKSNYSFHKTFALILLQGQTETVCELVMAFDLLKYLSLGSLYLDS